MTLAVAILILGIPSLTLVDPGLIAQSTPQQDSSANTQVTPEQTPQRKTEQEGTKPSSAQPPNTQAPASKPQPSTTKKARQREKVVPAAVCDPPPANSPPPGSDPSMPSPQPGGAQTSSTPDPKPCPPSKVIVKQGGIAEQSIQLAGGSAGDGATQKREAANRMIEATEQNLNKLTGRSLSNTERSSVLQIRQFVVQAKSALTAGNLERAQTLAWKAKLLSDDLLNPK